MMVGEGLFSGIIWFCYIYLIASCAFLTVNIVKQGFLSKKEEPKKPGA